MRYYNHSKHMPDRRVTLNRHMPPVSRISRHPNVAKIIYGESSVPVNALFDDDGVVLYDDNGNILMDNT